MEVQELIMSIAKQEEAKNHLSQVLDAYKLMDYHKLNYLLDEGYYQDMQKTAFIYKQKQIFNYMQKKGDTHLNLSTNICTGCLCGKPVFVLTGNQSGLIYAIYVEFLNNDIVDIFICSEQSNSSFGMLPF
ncbi:hypothetical protein [Formosa maritima]|uniref:Uncharacterized protein n=1 Tax=Formosa maritima TaxID=2592046 RepID=A0A5D0GFW2_9FLAO|nr:hypothetical protein [Formosa maritima]TYA56697.1 hypothetical protein FVF61_06065 [Formosa maritima]